MQGSSSSAVLATAPRTATASRPRTTAIVAAALLLAGLAAPLVVQDEFFVHSLIMVLYFAYLASAWNLMCGYVGQVSFGHSVFSGVGGYCSVLLLTGMGLSPWLGMLVGGALAAVLAVGDRSQRREP